MSLTPGDRIGQYQIGAQLGAGGMGEVYKARDTRLQRQVAIKILPAAFAADPDRLARFEREAQVLASLNHPNIAQIYGVEENAGVSALVMELVDGPTLAAVIAQHRPATRATGSHGSRLEIDRIHIARQLADALEVAHEQGIIHRDLKPQNIILRPDGTVKVLDFGLAKALDPVSGGERPDNSPTITNAATQVGTLLGTAAYMAPEQVKGRGADRRADIWAFGAVLYELFTGTMAFGGDTTTETLARVIEREPDWSRLPADTPPAILRLLHRTLVKDPKRRLQSIGDARLELEEGLSAPAEIASTAGRKRSRNTRWVIGAVALAAAAGLGAVAGRMTRPGAVPHDAPIRASIALPPGTFLDGSGPPVVALSPDGGTLAFVARGAVSPSQLYIRALGADAATPVPGSESAEGPFFSPDGRWVGFAVGVSGAGSHRPELRKYSLDTGLTQTISSVVDYFGATWREDGTIVFVNHQPQGLWMVNSAGGAARQVAAKLLVDGKDVATQLAWPSSIPGSRWVLVTRGTNSRVGELIAVDLDSRRMVSLGVEGAAPQLLSNGYLIYANASAALMAARFDSTRLRIEGTPTAILPDVAFARGNMPAVAVAANGTLAFVPGYLRYSRREPMQLVRISPNGTAKALAFEPDLLSRGLALSPDGNQLAVTAWDSSRWIFDIRRGTRQRQPPGPIADIYSLVWHPDGRRLGVGGPMVNSGSWGVVTDPLDSTAREVLAEEPAREIFIAGWLADKRSYAGWTSEPDGAAIVIGTPGEPPRMLIKETASINFAAVSPNRLWLAYDSTSAGAYHIYVLPIAGASGRVQVSALEGNTPRWSPDGKELFFRSGRSLMAVDVHTVKDGIDFTNERKLFDGDIARDYDVAPNGDIFTMAPAPEIAYQKHVQLRTRWFDEVERVMRGNR